MKTDEIEKLLAEVTPGPWFYNDDPRDGMEWNIHIHHTDEDRICFMSNMGESRVDEVEANARLIAVAPDLAAEVVRLRKALEEIVEPTAAMEDRLEDGERLDELMAIALAHDAAYLKGIARAALEGRDK